jgi:hypothetical protein
MVSREDREGARRPRGNACRYVLAKGNGLGKRRPWDEQPRMSDHRIFKARERSVGTGRSEGGRSCCGPYQISSMSGMRSRRRRRMRLLARETAFSDRPSSSATCRAGCSSRAKS